LRDILKKEKIKMSYKNRINKALKELYIEYGSLKKFSPKNKYGMAVVYFVASTQWKFIEQILDILGDDYEKPTGVDFIVMNPTVESEDFKRHIEITVGYCQKFISSLEGWLLFYSNKEKKQKIKDKLNELKEWLQNTGVEEYKKELNIYDGIKMLQAIERRKQEFLKDI